MADNSEEVEEEREEVEENEEEMEDKSEDFLSGSGGFDLSSPPDFVFGCEETAGDSEEEKGESVWWLNAPGLGVRGEEGLMGEDTGVPGVGVLD